MWYRYEWSPSLYGVHIYKFIQTYDYKYKRTRMIHCVINCRHAGSLIFKKKPNCWWVCLACHLYKFPVQMVHYCFVGCSLRALLQIRILYWILFEVIEVKAIMKMDLWNLSVKTNEMQMPIFKRSIENKSCYTIQRILVHTSAMITCWINQRSPSLRNELCIKQH